MKLMRSLFSAGRDPEPVVGGIYIVPQSDGGFQALKVLALDARAVHVRTYSNVFPSRPASLDPSELFMARFEMNGDGVPQPPAGPPPVGHMPMTRRMFLGWQPELVTVAGVSEDELDGYQYWKEAGGGVFG